MRKLSAFHAKVNDNKAKRKEKKKALFENLYTRVKRPVVYACSAALRALAALTLSQIAAVTRIVTRSAPTRVSWLWNAAQRRGAAVPAGGAARVPGHGQERRAIMRMHAITHAMVYPRVHDLVCDDGRVLQSTHHDHGQKIPDLGGLWGTALGTRLYERR